MVPSMTKVFVHGNPEVAAIWSPLVEHLALREVEDVVLLSPPGFGAPVAADWRATMSAYVDWLGTEVEAIGGPVDLVGHDWGAGHVYGLLARGSTAVRSFAADCAGLLHPEYVWHDAAQAWQTPEVGEQVVDAMVEAPEVDRVAMMAGLGIPEQIATAMAAAITTDMGRCILELYRDATQAALVDLGRRLLVADRPRWLVIEPTDDPYVASALARDVADDAGADVLTLEGLGHWWMIEDPAAAADGLVRFWASA